MATPARPHYLVCPKCGWSDIRAAKVQGFWDRALTLLALAPYRCRKCRARFHRAAWFAKRPAPQPGIEHRQVPPSIEKLAELAPASILLLDPDEKLRKLMARVLNKMGYVVREASRTQEALFELTQKEVDLVVANLNDPNLNGDPPTLIRKLRNSHPAMKILAHSVTGSEMFSMDLKEANRGRLLVLPKPSRTKAVIDGIRELVPTTR